MSTINNKVWIPIERLRTFVIDALFAVGVKSEDAKMVADVLITADLRGIDSHGVSRLRRYVDGIRKGKIVAQPEVQVLQRGPTSAVLDARNGLGQPAAIRGMEMAIRIAEQMGIGMVSVRRSNHFGIAGYYVLRAIDHKMIGVATTNASPQVAPTFAAEPMYGTNPIAIGLPTGGDYPFVLDMATSIVPRGKLEQLRRTGKSMLSGWALDPNGKVTSSIDDVVEGLINKRGYALLPLGGAGEAYGGHKGFGLGLLIDLICGPLSGAAWGKHVYGPDGANLGHCFLAMRVDCFRSPEEFANESDELLTEIRVAKKAKGTDRIYIPGEKEAMEQKIRLLSGIPLEPPVYADLINIASEVGIPVIQPRNEVQS